MSFSKVVQWFQKPVVWVATHLLGMKAGVPAAEKANAVLSPILQTALDNNRPRVVTAIHAFTEKEIASLVAHTFQSAGLRIRLYDAIQSLDLGPVVTQLIVDQLNTVAIPTGEDITEQFLRELADRAIAAVNAL